MLNKIVLLALFVFLPQLANAAEASLSLAAGDSAWMILAGALVFFMQAGFALLESGSSRSKNSVNVVMKNFVDACFGSLAFWLIGYGIMFGINENGWFGSSHFAVSNGEPLEYSFIFFQTMFAATAVTIASGAMAERTRYSAYVIGAVFICSLIYPVYGSWVWGSYYEGSGWLSEKGFIDFAGSTVVHSVAGWIALAGIIVLGPRIGRFTQDGKTQNILGHNLNSIALGGFILWLGWYGFNAGSTLTAEDNIGMIALNTHLAAAAGVAGAVVTMFILRINQLVTLSINGAIGGLVGITAGCASMTPLYAVITGFIAGGVVIVGTLFLEKLKLDDVVGAVPVHGFAGVWGTLAAGIFYQENMFDISIITIQAQGILAAFVWTFPTALLMYFIIDKLIGLRIDPIGEQRGLDYAEHYEVAYPEFQKEILHKGK